MKKLTLITLIAILSGCSHSIRRYGYNINKRLIPNDSCHVPFLKNMPTDTTKFKKIGRIRLGDTGFSKKCNENDALQILKKEACLLGADVVNILGETRPDFWSTCYRVEAEFLINLNAKNKTLNGCEVIGEVTPNDYKYDTDTSAVMSRVEKDNKRNAIMSLISFGTGIIAGLLLVWPITH